MIWVIPHHNRLVEYQHLNQYWIEFLDKISDTYEICILEGSRMNNPADILYTDSYVKGSQIQEISELFHHETVKDGDVFLFTDAWHPGVITLSYLRRYSKIRFSMIGIWAESYFAESILHWTRYYKDTKTEYEWVRNFERGLFQAYDYCCFRDEVKMWIFRRRYWDLKNFKHWKVTGLPLEYLQTELVNLNIENKEDIVVCPYPISEEQTAILESLRIDFPNWKIISVVDNNANRIAYKELLKRAKVVLFLNSKDAVNLHVIYEILCNKCRLLMPNTSQYKKYFDDFYRYPAELVSVKKKFHFLRRRFLLQDIISNAMENYAASIPRLEADCNRIKTEYFNEQPFLDIIDNANRKFSLGGEMETQKS